MKKILIADDHHVVRNGLKHVLIDEFPNSEFGEAEDGKEVLKKLKEDKWDVLILDINMPGKSGLDVLQQLKDEQNNCPVLVMSMHSEEQVAVRVLKLGAYSYLSKDAPEDEIVNAVHKLFSGRKYITPNLAQILANQIEDNSTKLPHEILSHREYQILTMIGKGLQVSKIAEELCLGVSTVSTYRARILEKMHLKCNVEIMAYVLENKLQ